MIHFFVPFSGSSPLARGLPPPLMRRAAACRIIPARAGFTMMRDSIPATHQDHPRSRGVYTQRRRRARVPVGSSPLARGLRGVFLRRRRRIWIIPARAGFTTSKSSAARSRGDHPRSRGVYRGFGNQIPAPLGSSPLARGLRGAGEDDRAETRIIPARAGFTRSIRRLSGAIPDHPRSRGVYALCPAYSGQGGGSSPLARGLRGWTHMMVINRGIIPARAGFTKNECHLL